MLGQSVVHTFLSTVHGCVHPISGNASLEQGRSVPRGSSAPVPMLEGSGEAKNAPDGLQGSGALMTSWGLGRGGRHP
jgi:hypothetical protein